MRNTDAYSLYLQDISAYSRISPEREAILSRTIQGDGPPESKETAISELIHANLRLVVHCQKEFERFRRSARLSELDLIAEGNMGLIKAAQNFNVDNAALQTRFSTYACKCIRSHMLRALKKSRFIHIPEHHFSYWSSMETLEQEKGGTLSDEDLRARLDLSEEALSLIRHSASSRVCRLEDLSPDDKEGSWTEFIACETTRKPDQEAEDNDLRSFLKEELKTLSPRTRKIITLLYFNEHAPTLKDLSLRFGISSERCRQICVQGLKRLRHQMFARRRNISPDLAKSAFAA